MDAHPGVGASTGDPSPVVLVHGIISSRYLLPMVRELARSTRVLVPALPGYGPRDRVKGTPDLATQADAVAAAIVEWGVPTTTVVGHSIGAEVVVELARRHPSLVERAVLVGPTGDPHAAGVFGVWTRWMATAVHEPLSFNLLTVAEFASLGPRRMIDVVRRSFADPIEAKLSEVRCPTLLVRGARDRVAPQAWLDRMASQIADTVTVTLADSAHTIVYTESKELADLVIRFASGTEVASGLGPQGLDAEVGVVPGQEPGGRRGPVP
ncbi:MAG TPA: alpha/beta hydrolase [Acidimicrobiales bacterium]|nr:alpha/beta hydrolase [Acidimicrobiales bacterium]